MVWFTNNVDQRHAGNFDPPFSKVVQCAGYQALQVALQVVSSNVYNVCININK